MFTVPGDVTSRYPIRITYNNDSPIPLYEWLKIAVFGSIKALIFPQVHSPYGVAIIRDPDPFALVLVVDEFNFYRATHAKALVLDESGGLNSGILFDNVTHQAQ